MKFYYDFHLHTALSPCGDDEMTPNNVVNLASLLGLDIIAITDHNSYLNIESCLKVGKDKDIIILPGMEVETIEEIHMICLFSELELCIDFGKVVEERLNKVKNNEKIFGPQIIMDEYDEEIGKYENLLITSTNIDTYEIIELANKYEGIAIPAHIDRASHSIISNLGFIPPDLKVRVVEFSTNANPESFLSDMKKISNIDYKYIISSDAHYLEHMAQAKNFLEFDQKPSKKEIIEKLRNL